MGFVDIMAFQTKVLGTKEENLKQMAECMEKADLKNVDMVTFPEMFLCPYETKCFPVFAEREGERAWQWFSRLAKTYRVYLSAGTMPELGEDGRIYNTAYVFDREGRQIAKHRKIHLFDVDIQGGQYFKESETLSPGNEATVFDTEFGKMGLCICYDFRFPELARQMVNRGAQLFIVPAAFNMTTGPAHWELLYRSRAVDNQVFTVGTAPARDMTASYHSWGHSLVVNPWGEVLVMLDEKEGSLRCRLDLEQTEAVRRQLPLLAHRRRDIYPAEF